MTFKEFLQIFCENDKNIIDLFQQIDYNKIQLQNKNLYENDFYNEQWKKIPYYNYELSNYGRVRNLTTNKIKSQRISMYGNQIMLWNKSEGRLFTISRLVASIYIRKVKSNEKVIHIDKNIRNNYVKNLKIERVVK